MAYVPFQMEGTHAGFGRCDGVAKLEDDHLVFEVQSKVAGIMKTELKVVRVPLSDVSKIEYDGGFFSSNLQVVFKSMSYTQDFPRSEGSSVTLELKRRDRKAAQELEKDVKMGMISTSIDDMLEMTNRALK